MSNFTYSKGLYHAAVMTGNGGGKTKKKPTSKPVASIVKKEAESVAKKIPTKFEKSAPTQTGIVGKLSKYIGGFVKVGNRMNNSKAYNHDYYLKNKHKWQKKNKFKSWIDALSNSFSKTMKSVSHWVDVQSLVAKRRIQRLLGKSFNKKVKDIANPILHKYLYRIFRNGRWRYFYTDSEYHSFLNRVKRINGEHSVEDDAKAVNPNYDPFDPQSYLYSVNCATCSVMYDLRRRGYDVSAMDHFGNQDNGGMMMWQMEDLYEGNGERASGNFVSPVGIESIDMDDPYSQESREIARENCKKLYDELSTYPDGARGIMGMYWVSGGGHAISWEVVDGKAVIIDSQCNTIFDNPDDFANEYGEYVLWGVSEGVGGNAINDINERNGADTKDSDQSRYEVLRGFQYMRTDNANIREDVLKGAEYDADTPMLDVTENEFVYEVDTKKIDTKRHYNK